MIALDTNVAVRLLVADDPVQALRARTLVERNRVFLSTTVILEIAWVLRAGYRFEPDRIAAAFRALFGLPQVTLSSPIVVSAALDAFALGLDFADALHLASAGRCEQFATFDRKLIQKASKVPNGVPVVEP
jgi:predicted nucleic-acid-binding protein